jgi:hypothetical protein
MLPDAAKLTRHHSHLFQLAMQCRNLQPLELRQPLQQQRMKLHA